MGQGGFNYLNVLISDFLCIFPKLQILIYFYLQRNVWKFQSFFYLKVQKLPQNLVCGGKISLKANEFTLKNLENDLIYKAKISQQSFYTWPGFKLYTFQGHQRWLSRKCCENVMIWDVMTLISFGVFIQHQLSGRHEVQQQYSFGSLSLYPIKQPTYEQSLFTLAGRKNSGGGSALPWQSGGCGEGGKRGSIGRQDNAHYGGERTKM